MLLCPSSLAMKQVTQKQQLGTLEIISFAHESRDDWPQGRSTVWKAHEVGSEGAGNSSQRCPCWQVWCWGLEELYRWGLVLLRLLGQLPLCAISPHGSLREPGSSLAAAGSWSKCPKRDWQNLLSLGSHAVTFAALFSKVCSLLEELHRLHLLIKRSVIELEGMFLF